MEECIVCGPADAALTVPGSVFNRHCAECGRRVMLAPAGQAFSRAHPAAQIICYDCHLKACAQASNISFGGILGPGGKVISEPGAVAREAERIDAEKIPNQWRKRN